jgi:type VI secretion system secreted protein VgrG
VQGVQTAVVTGPSGEEIHTDQYGRVKVQFHWDRRGKKDDTTSCWMRVSQIHAGKSFGGIDIPRIGDEVIVSFLEGDPDMPLISGRVYHAESMPPFGLPAAKNISGLKSNSTLGGGGYNEYVMDDTKGNELIREHGQFDKDSTIEHDLREHVLHDRSRDVTNNETVKVGNNRSKTIGKDETTKVGVNRTETVGKNETIAIGSNRSEVVGKNETIGIGANRTETVGKNESITVGKSRSKKVGKNESAKIGSSQSTQIGKNQGIKVGGNRAEQWQRTNP